MLSSVAEFHAMTHGSKYSINLQHERYHKTTDHYDEFNSSTTDMLTPLPNFFIVGSPKCGTTSLYEYLRHHPEIYLPHDGKNYWLAKEPYYFCQELIKRPGMAIANETEYRKLFEKATQSSIGDATSLNLFSQFAPQRIYDFCPQARIIIILREPVSLMRSWHGDCLRHGHEDVADFQKAVELSCSRQLGQQLPRGSGYPDCLQYRDMATFSYQIERYQAVFPSSQIKILLLDDFSQQPEATFRDVLEFLKVDPTFKTQLVKHNEQIELTSGTMLVNYIRNRLRRHQWLLKLRQYIPISAESAARWIPGKTIPRQLNREFERLLHQQMQPEIDRLEKILNRNLAAWRSM